jgi:hypothetical protein
MTNSPGAGNDLEQFLVAPRSNAAASDLAAFEQALQAIPGASILKRAGRPDQPRLVVALTTDSFEKLRERFGTSLIMERDAPLTPL